MSTVDSSSRLAPLPTQRARPQACPTCAMQEPMNSRIRAAGLQGSSRDEEMAAPLTSSSRAPSRTRLLAERALSPFFAPESADSSTDPSAQPHRLVRRDSAFHQSSGKINMHRGLRADRLLGLAKRDWYHVLLSMKSRSLLPTLTLTLTAHPNPLTLTPPPAQYEVSVAALPSFSSPGEGVARSPLA